MARDGADRGILGTPAVSRWLAMVTGRGKEDVAEVHGMGRKITANYSEHHQF